MRRLVAVLGLAVGLILAAPSGVSASHDPSGGPFDEDFVTGTAMLDDCPLGCFIATVDAHSGPLGENPTGTAQYGLRVNQVGGPVTCLTVSGNRAVVGGESVLFLGPGYLFVFEDNAAAGTPDRFAFVDGFLPAPPTSCPAPADLNVSFVRALSGDIVVHDARGKPTTKDQCKNGGWRTFGVFKNQGACVRFVRHQARQACIFERAAHGRAAFRAKYGKGKHHRHAMRGCIRTRING